MKKFLAILLAVLTLFTLTGCKGEEELSPEILAYRVPTPATYPDYTFDHNPTPDELRQMAIEAMRDILSIQWCTEREITYRKTGPVNYKLFNYQPLNTYCGLHYSNASTGLFQFLEYYDYETGYLRYPGDSRDLKINLGSSCADSILWAYSTVATSFTGGYYTVFMVPGNGYIPVGNYKIPEGIETYQKKTTKKIIQENPKDVIYEAYASVKPADVLVNSVGNHAVMVIAEPIIYYDMFGKIDINRSSVIVQDQRAGGTTFYENMVDGQIMYFNGCLSSSKTFAELYKQNYIPLTIKEFIGEKDYERAQVTVSNEKPTSLSELKEVVVSSNYPLAIINAYAVSPTGKETLLKKVIFGGYDELGVPRSYRLGDIKELSKINWFFHWNSTIKFEVVVSTGERFEVLSYKN